MRDLFATDDGRCDLDGQDEKIEGQLDAIIADEELKAVHLLDFGLFSQNREDFPPDANALIYNFNKEVCAHFLS